MAAEIPRLEQRGLSVLCWWGWVVRATLFNRGFPCCSLLLRDPLCTNARGEQCAVNQLLFLPEKSAGPRPWSQHTGAVALGEKILLLVRAIPPPEGRAEGPALLYSGILGTCISHFVAKDTVPEAFLQDSEPGAFPALESYLSSPIPAPA